MSALTASQTVGPYFRIGLDWPEAWRIADADTPGERLSLVGTVYDGAGAAVPDALVELWQADAAGRHYGEDGCTCRGSGRAAVDDHGTFRFATVKPGRVAAPDGRLQAPHLNLLLFARGLLVHLHTRVYFADEVAANGECPVLARVPAARRDTLVAVREGSAWRFDIHLQGARETVFFDAC